jgi:hypothetical protein
MRAVLIAAVIALGVSAHVPGLAQGQSAPRVQVTFEPNGLVTLVVNGASAREVLSEWSRQGGSKFVNAERLASTPLTLEFKSQPEADVIGSILRLPAWPAPRRQPRRLEFRARLHSSDQQPVRRGLRPAARVHAAAACDDAGRARR